MKMNKLVSLILIILFLTVFPNFTLGLARGESGENPLITPEIEVQKPELEILSKKLLLSEINWAGSGYSLADEWVEIYNFGNESINLKNIYLVITKWKKIENIDEKDKLEIVKTNEIKLVNSGNETIEPKSLILVSNYDNNHKTKNVFSSALDIKPDFVSNSVEIPNSFIDIQIIEKVGQEALVLDKYYSGPNPTFGLSITGIRASMERDFTKPDLPWVTSESVVNLKNPKREANCKINYGTPGVIYSPKKKETPVSIDFRATCLNGIDADNGVIANIDGVKKIELDPIIVTEPGSYSFTFNTDIVGDYEGTELDLKYKVNNQEFIEGKFAKANFPVTITFTDIGKIQFLLENPTEEPISLLLSNIYIKKVNSTHHLWKGFEKSTKIILPQNTKTKMKPQACLASAKCKTTIKLVNQNAIVTSLETTFGTKKSSAVYKRETVKLAPGEIQILTFESPKDQSFALELKPDQENIEILESSFQTDSIESTNINKREILERPLKLIHTSPKAFGGEIVFKKKLGGFTKGKYKLSISAKTNKLSKSGDDIFLLRIYDKRTNRVLEKLVDENDFTQLEQVFTDEGSLNLDSELTIYIFHYRLHSGSTVDVEIKSVLVERVE